MAKIEEPQTIPSELLKGYQGALGEVRLDAGVHKRHPFRIPTMQTLVGHPTIKQKEQRARFIIAKDNFADVDWPTRQRWYAAAPEWGSFLWYYNYFIMSSLNGNANIDSGGAGVIKSLKYYTATMLAGAPANIEIPITEVDPGKTVSMLFGAGYKEFIEGASTIVYPYPVSIVAELLIVKASMEIDANAGIGVIVIEYI